MEQKNALNRQLCTSIQAFTDRVTKAERDHIAVLLIKKYPCLKGSVGAGHVSDALVKMVPGSWRDLGKIPARFPPGSRRDFGRRDSRFPPGFLPGFLAGGGIPGGQNLGGIPAGILPGFLAGDGIPGGQNLGGIPAGILPGFLAGGGIPGGQNLGGIPAGILPGFLAGDGIPGGQNLGGIPAGVLPGFLAGNRISRWECCRDLRRETKFLAVKIFPAAKISGGPVWNFARIRDENVININQTTRR